MGIFRGCGQGLRGSIVCVYFSQGHCIERKFSSCIFKKECGIFMFIIRLMAMTVQSEERAINLMFGYDGKNVIVWCCSKSKQNSTT